MNYFKCTQMKRIVLLLVLVSFANLAFAQGQHQRMKAAKVGFITNKLNLSPEQAEKFWPLYNDYSEKRENLRIERRMTIMEMNKNGISDGEAKRMIEQELKSRQSELDLETEFYAGVQKVISPTQALSLIKAEREFNMEVLRNLQRRGGPGDTPNRRQPRN